MERHLLTISIHEETCNVYLGINNDFHVERIGFLQSLDGRQGYPQIIRVEDLKFRHRFELIHVGLGHLSDFYQTHLSFILSERTSLEVGKESRIHA